MATTILLYHRKNWRDEGFPADFTTWFFVKNPPDGRKTLTKTKTFSSIKPYEHVYLQILGTP